MFQTSTFIIYLIAAMAILYKIAILDSERPSRKNKIGYLIVMLLGAIICCSISYSHGKNRISDMALWFEEDEVYIYVDHINRGNFNEIIVLFDPSINEERAGFISPEDDIYPYFQDLEKGEAFMINSSQKFFTTELVPVKTELKKFLRPHTPSPSKG